MGHAEIDWAKVFCGTPSSAPHAAPTRAGPSSAKRARALARVLAEDDEQPRGNQRIQSPAAAMGHVEIDWAKVFCGSPSSAPHAAATRAGPSSAKRARARARVLAEFDEQPRGNRRIHRRWQRFGMPLHGAQVESGARSPVTRAAAKVLQAAADPGLDAHSAAEKISQGSNQEDERVGDVSCTCKYGLKPSPVLIGRKKNHVQVDGKCKRVARPAMKNGDKEVAPPEEIFEALREIPRLERADLMRAYSALIRDDRLFRSLMVLPKDMRKDWLLMEIGNQ